MDTPALEWDPAKAAARIHADPDHSASETVRSLSAIPQDKRMQLTSLTAAPGRRERRLLRPSGLTGGALAHSLSRVLGGPGVEYRRRGTRRRMMSWRMLVLAGFACCLGSVSAASEPGVRPVGVYPFALPGLMARPDARPKALLWCQGANLMGVVVPDDTGNDCGTASPKRSAPGALLLRDGRCESDGTMVSFGFLVPRKA